MSKTLSPDHPNLVQAASRLQRMFWAWGSLFLVMGFFTAAVLRENYPLASAPWIVSGILVLTGRQPAYLALVAVLWGMSITSLIPNLSNLVGPDPISVMLELSSIEAIALAVVRLVLLIMAWNQFMFYRILYGTEQMSGLEEDIPAIPELIANKTDQIARIAQFVAALGLVVVWASSIMNSDALTGFFLSLAYAASILSIGLGMGVVFSPTARRKIALSAIGIGFIVFISIFLVGRFTLL
jgi:hypothetical protein